MKIVCTIEARMTSSRLPGKVLMEAAGRPMLEHMINRLKRVKKIDEIVVATTINSTDDPIYERTKAWGVHCFRGSEDDVALRVIEAAQSRNADLVVQTTGDCPLIDPEIIDNVIELYLKSNCDVACNTKIRCFPDGMDVVVMKLELLKKSYSETKEKRHREHVVLHLFENMDRFRFVHFGAPPELNYPQLGLTLDEVKDYELIRKIIEHFEKINPKFSCLDIVELLNKNPDWKKINSQVVRKTP